MSEQRARPERPDRLLEYFRSLVATPDEPTKEMPPNPNRAARFEAQSAPSEGDDVEERELVLIARVDITTSAGRLMSPEFVLAIGRGLPKSCLRTLEAMGEISGVAEANGTRLSVIVCHDHRAIAEMHICPLNYATDALDPWEWELEEPRSRGAS